MLLCAGLAAISPGAIAADGTAGSDFFVFIDDLGTPNWSNMALDLRYRPISRFEYAVIQMWQPEKPKSAPDVTVLTQHGAPSPTPAPHAALTIAVDPRAWTPVPDPEETYIPPPPPPPPASRGETRPKRNKLGSGITIAPPSDPATESPSRGIGLAID